MIGPVGLLQGPLLAGILHDGCNKLEGTHFPSRPSEFGFRLVRCCDQVLSIASLALLNVLLRHATFTRMYITRKHGSRGGLVANVLKKRELQLSVQPVMACPSCRSCCFGDSSNIV